MAQALASGIAESSSDISFLISDPNIDAEAAFTALLGNEKTFVATSNRDVLEQCSTVFLAVKPQHLTEALAEVESVAAPSPLLISIVAGISSEQISKLTGNLRVIRVMPNTPCLIRQGVSAIAIHAAVSDNDESIARSLLESVGKVVLVPESMLDSVTGLSGSGPAFVFNFIESLVDGAVLTGMPRGLAEELAIQTVIGSAAMVQQTGQHTSVLRDRVASPGGTTVYGLKALEENGFRNSVMSAVQAATERSRELQKM